MEIHCYLRQISAIFRTGLLDLVALEQIMITRRHAGAPLPRGKTFQNRNSLLPLADFRHSAAGPRANQMAPDSRSLINHLPLNDRLQKEAPRGFTRSQPTDCSAGFVGGQNTIDKEGHDRLHLVG
jgi:hypothetical protein